MENGRELKRVQVLTKTGRLQLQPRGHNHFDRIDMYKT